MHQVKVKKRDLQSRIQNNRDNHREVYERAIEGYRRTVIDWFNENVDKAKAGKAFETFFSLPKPEDHTRDYDRVLDMLMMSTDEEIMLSSSEFAQYVRDDWGWKQEFSTTSANYVR